MKVAHGQGSGGPSEAVCGYRRDGYHNIKKSNGLSSDGEGLVGELAGIADHSQIRFVGASGGQHVHHLKSHVHIGHLNVAVFVCVRVLWIVDQFTLGLICGNLRNPNTLEAVSVSGIENRFKGHNLALIGLAVDAFCRIGIGDVLRSDIDPDFFSVESASGDATGS